MKNESIVNLIDENHENRPQERRYHLGCSALGNKCDRSIWLNFRWAIIPKFTGRILRLFRRGHNEEMHVIDDLRNIGFDIKHTQESNQFTVDFGCHVSGSLDGIITKGLGEKSVLEIKTHNTKSFDKLLKSPLKTAHYKHYAQVQLYMHGAKLTQSLYYAVCKNDDRVFTCIVEYDENFAEQLLERAKHIALSDEMPPPISTDPTWYECKMCDSYDFCHKSKLSKEINCRTCAHVTPKDDSTFYCERFKGAVPNGFQSKGCDSHAMHPQLVPWELKEQNSGWQPVYLIDGEEVINGPDDGGYTSSEIVANHKLCARKDDFTENLRDEFGARIVG